MKKILLSSIVAVGLLMTGCSTSKVEPEKTPYVVFDKGVISNSEKVLIDSSYQTFLNNEDTNVEKGQKILYKTSIFFKDKNYVIFLSEEMKAGSPIEFILKDEKLTNIQTVD
jgi:hypothetical protein